MRVSEVFDRAAPTYGTVVPFFDEVGRVLVEHAQVRREERVLDVGCGRGAALFPAADAAGPSGQAVGIDIAPGMVRLAAEEARARGLANVTVRVGDAEAPDFPPESFDVILASVVLLFLPDRRTAVRRCAELLVPGGRLAVSVLMDRDLERWRPVEDTLRSFIPGPAAPPPDPEAWFATLRSDLDGAGLTDIEFVDQWHDSTFDSADHWWSWMESSGYRGRIEQIPPDHLAAARRALAKAMELVRDPDGRIVWRVLVRHTRARRPVRCSVG